MNFDFEKERISRLSQERVRTLMVLEHLNEWYWPRYLVVLLPCSLPPSPHVKQLEKGDPTNQGHCQQGTSSKKERYKCHPVRMFYTHMSMCSGGRHDCITMATHDMVALAISIYYYRKYGNFRFHGLHKPREDF